MEFIELIGAPRWFIILVITIAVMEIVYECNGGSRMSRKALILSAIFVIVFALGAVLLFYHRDLLRWYSSLHVTRADFAADHTQNQDLQVRTLSSDFHSKPALMPPPFD